MQWAGWYTLDTNVYYSSVHHYILPATLHGGGTGLDESKGERANFCPRWPQKSRKERTDIVTGFPKSHSPNEKRFTQSLSAIILIPYKLYSTSWHETRHSFNISIAFPAKLSVFKVARPDIPWLDGLTSDLISWPCCMSRESFSPRTKPSSIHVSFVRAMLKASV